MPVNKNKLLRIQTIDECLQRRGIFWSVDDLIEACKEKQSEMVDGKISISKRSIAQDISEMKSGTYGYYAPIKFDRTNKGYIYTDPYFSINSNPIKPDDIPIMEEALESMNHLKPSELVDQFFELVTRVKGKMNIDSDNISAIQYDHAPKSTGIQWLEAILNHIKNKEVLEITYRPFEKEKQVVRIHPYLLKEFNNRWFLIGFDENHNKISNRALDRILIIKTYKYIAYKENTYFDLKEYFQNMIGVTRLDGSKVEIVTFKTPIKQARYLETKPIHHSQKIIRKDAEQVTFQIELVLNFELEQALLRLGEDVKILSPQQLVTKMKERIEKMNKNYK